MTYGVHLIAAVGLSGQIGLRGKVPWHGLAKYADVTRRDLDEFARLTEGGVLLIGSRTAENLPSGFQPKDRVVIVWKRNMITNPGPKGLLGYLRETYAQRNIWICGGEMVYRIFMPFVDWHHISVVPYDGAADSHLPPIIPGWTMRTDDGV